MTTVLTVVILAMAAAVVDPGGNGFDSNEAGTVTGTGTVTGEPLVI